MYRIGKKQKRAILTFDGHEVVVFNKGKESLAEKVCNLLNADLKVNKISSSAVLAVTSDSTENKKESEVALLSDFKEQLQKCYDEIYKKMMYPMSMKGQEKADDIMKRYFPFLTCDTSEENHR